MIKVRDYLADARIARTMTFFSFVSAETIWRFHVNSASYVGHGEVYNYYPVHMRVLPSSRTQGIVAYLGRGTTATEILTNR